MNQTFSSILEMFNLCWRYIIQNFVNLFQKDIKIICVEFFSHNCKTNQLNNVVHQTIVTLLCSSQAHIEIPFKLHQTATKSNFQVSLLFMNMINFFVFISTKFRSLPYQPRYCKIKSSLQLRNSQQRCSAKKDVLKSFEKFTGKHLCRSLFK